MNKLTESEAAQLVEATASELFGDSAWMADELETNRALWPDADLGKLASVTVHDCLSDVAARTESLLHYLGSVSWLMSAYLEEAGADVPKLLEHVALDMDHAVTDCERLSRDAYAAARAACELMERREAA